MIQSKRINVIVAIAIVLALVTSVGLVVVGNIQYAKGALKTEPAYATKVFGPDIISIEIIADKADWQKMLDNAMSEQYIMADVIVNGTKFQKVGIRTKGNSSLYRVVNSDSNRYSFRLKFDEYIKDQTCFGLDSFVLNNMIGDNTYMKEYVSYELMHEIGVDAPYFGFADIKVNGENWGLYLAVESYGDSYELRTFGTTRGMLYNVKMDGRGMQPLGGGQGSIFPWVDMQPPAGGQSGNLRGEGVQPPSDMQRGNLSQRNTQPPANRPGESTQSNYAEESAAPSTQFGPQRNGISMGDQTGGQIDRQFDGQIGRQTDEIGGQTDDQTGRLANGRPDGPMGRPTDGQMDRQMGGPIGRQAGGAADRPTEGQMSRPRASQTGEPTERQMFEPIGRPGGNFVGMMGGGRSSGGSLEYTTDDISSYGAIFNNVVGKGNEEDFKRVITAIKALSKGENLEKYFDVDKILRYLAAHTVVVNLDSYSSGMAQNYYLYENNGKITILPWDYNLAWGGFQSGNASAVINFPIDTPVSGVEMRSRPLIDKLLSNSQYLEMYHSYLQELMTNYFADGKWEEKITQLDALISDYVKNDKTAFCTFDEYEAAVEAFKILGNLRYQSIQGQLDGTVPSTTAGQSANPDKLISAGNLRLSVLGSMGGVNRGGMAERPAGRNNQQTVESFAQERMGNISQDRMNDMSQNRTGNTNQNQMGDIGQNRIGGVIRNQRGNTDQNQAGNTGRNRTGNAENGFMQRPGAGMQNPAPGTTRDNANGSGNIRNDTNRNSAIGNNVRNNMAGNNAMLTPFQGAVRPPLRGQAAVGVHASENLLFYSGLFVFLLFSTFLVAKKKRNY